MSRTTPSYSYLVVLIYLRGYCLEELIEDSVLNSLKITRIDRQPKRCNNYNEHVEISRNVNTVCIILFVQQNNYFINRLPT